MRKTDDPQMAAIFEKGAILAVLIDYIFDTDEPYTVAISDDEIRFIFENLPVEKMRTLIRKNLLPFDK